MDDQTFLAGQRGKCHSWLMNVHKEKHRKLISGGIIGPEGTEHKMHMMTLDKIKLERFK